MPYTDDKQVLRTLSCERIAKTIEYFLNKGDSIPFPDRTNAVYLPVNDKYFPEIFSPSYSDEDVLLTEYILLLQKYGIWKIVSSAKKRYLTLSQRNAKIVFNSEHEEAMRLHYSHPIPFSEWDVAIENYPFKNKKAFELLIGKPIVIPGTEPLAIISKFDEWVCLAPHTGTARQESAKCFWGLSKMFDNRTDISDSFSLSTTPIMLNIFSFSPTPNTVLFIENLDTFFAVTENNNTIFDNAVIIYSSGYRASAKRIRDECGSRLYFEAGCNFSVEGKEHFTAWLYRKGNSIKNVYFWGDLDYAGLGILLSLRNNFPDIGAWKDGYEPMVSLLFNKDGHLPFMAEKENQICPPVHALNAYEKDVLLGSIQATERFIDQEAINISDIGLTNALLVR